ncbi:helix-turn-helix domain-containing protein [Puteibacter caeruleilacunae]|nr:helix-turn-helix domain-containing protein [Puteibacter caeruleilacunae]
MKKTLLIILALFFLFADGYANRAIRFNDNYALFPTSPVLRPKDQITVECWIKAENYLNWGAPVCYLVDNQYDESGYALAFNEGEMRFMIKTDRMRGQDWTYNPGVHIELNQWCHIAGVYDGKSVKVYLNGLLQDERFVSGDIDWSFAPAQLSIGAFVDSNEMHHFYGCVDEVRIWNRGLAAAEIQANLYKSLTGSEDGLIFYLPMTGDGTIIKDHSKNHFDGRIINHTSESRTNSLAMVHPTITNSELLSTSSCNIEWSMSSKIEALKEYYVDVASDLKFNKILPEYNNVKVLDNRQVLSYLPGGQNYYVRVKGRLSNGDYTMYSEPYLIDGFSSSLSIDLYSKADKIKDHIIVLDDNVLTSSYVKLKKGTRSMMIESRLTSESLSFDEYAFMYIKGKNLDEEYDISRVSNLMLPELDPGKYTIDLKWGTDHNLSSSFVVEIERYWWQNVWFYVLVVMTLGGVVFLATKYIKIITKTRYQELLDGYVPIPEKDLEISENEMTNIYNRLVELMDEEKPYLEPRLSLKILGDKLDVSPTLLSHIIREKYGYYFNDFVNKYRIDEVKRQLKSKETSGLKIVAIAYKCGFNSESTFFRVFKKFTGETPSSYQKKMM